MKKHLLYTSHYENSLAEIKAAGGRVTHKFSKHAFVAHLPESATDNKLSRSSTDPLSDLDDVCSLLVKTWKELEADPPQQPVKKEPGFFLGNGHISSIENSPQMNEWQLGSGEQMTVSPGPMPPTTRQMTGTVIAGIVIVSGPKNSKLNFLASEEAKVTKQVMQACQFFIEKGLVAADLTFQYDIQKVDITAVPSTTCGSPEECEAVYRDPALTKMGYQVGMAGVFDYVTDIIKRSDTGQWGFAAFFSKYPMAAVFQGAYAGGVRLCLKYDYSWPAGQFASRFAFEVCGLFGAQAEFSMSQCTCAPTGYLDVPNNNCANCNNSGFLNGEPCLMKTNDWKLCPWTMGQIGWYATNAQGNPCIISYGKNSETAQLMYKDGSALMSGISFNGHGWLYDNVGFLSGGIKAAGDPQVIRFGPYAIHAVFRDLTNKIVDINFTGYEWTSENISNLSGGAPACAGNPGIISYDTSFLHVVYRSANSEIIDLSWDTVKWRRYENLTQLTGAPPAAGDPRVIQFALKQIHIAYRDTNNNIIYMIWDGVQWNQRSLTGPGIPKAVGDPCIIQYGSNAIHVIYRDVNNELTDITWDGARWVYLNLNNKASNAKKASGDPGVSLHNINDLYVVYRDADQQVSTIYYSAAQQAWSYKDLTNSVSGAAGVNGNPGIASFAQQLHVVYRDKNNQISDIMFKNSKWSYQQFKV